MKHSFRTSHKTVNKTLRLSNYIQDYEENLQAVTKDSDSVTSSTCILEYAAFWHGFQWAKMKLSLGTSEGMDQAP